MVLITGGSSSGRTTEIYNPLTKTSCSLPQLPEARNHHTQDGDLACGGTGSSSQTTCVTWSPASGTWTHSHTLRKGEYGRVSWATDSGVYLIGGSAGAKTQKVKLDGSVEEGFVLKYRTW